MRTFATSSGLLEEARLPDRVRERRIAAFSPWPRSRAASTGAPSPQVHFHEVGGHDTSSTSSAARPPSSARRRRRDGEHRHHGHRCRAHLARLAAQPAPGRRRAADRHPTVGRDVNVELTTPTGAAMLRAWGSGFGPLPMMTIESTGYGAGSHELEGVPNCTQVVIGTTTRTTDSVSGQPLTVLETNIDDATGETLAHAVSGLLGAGALDAWVTAVRDEEGPSRPRPRRPVRSGARRLAHRRHRGGDGQPRRTGPRRGALGGRAQLG